MSQTLQAFPPTVTNMTLDQVGLRDYHPRAGQSLRYLLWNRWAKVESIRYSYSAQTGDRVYLLDMLGSTLPMSVELRFADRTQLRLIDDPDFDYYMINDPELPYPKPQHFPVLSYTIASLRPLFYWGIGRQDWIPVLSIEFSGSISVKYRTADEEGTIIVSRQFENDMIFRRERAHAEQ